MDTLGLHIISTLNTTTEKNLTDYFELKQLLEQSIKELNLTSFGSVYHKFTDDDQSGYTAVVCLSESHISIHTWPEISKITLDVFLSNHSRNNEDKCEQLHDAMLAIFDVEELITERVYR